MVRVCDGATLAVSREFKGAAGYNLAGGDLSPDGKTLATFCTDKKVRLWEVSSGKEKAAWAVSAPRKLGHYYPMSYSPDGTYLALGVDGPVLCLFDANTGKEHKKPLGISRSPMHLVVFSPDGKLVALQSDEGPRMLETAKLPGAKGPKP
jgi:WD40 repeat protein